jgi:metal-responsive CopG/Arc/MetJ family transcriptional regulator
MAMARKQSLVQLSDALLSLLDERAVRSGRSRSALIREAIEQYLAADTEATIDQAIVSGYEAVPQEEDPWTDAAGRDAIAAEPW